MDSQDHGYPLRIASIRGAGRVARYLIGLLYAVLLLCVPLGTAQAQIVNPTVPRSCLATSLVQATIMNAAGNGAGTVLTVTSLAQGKVTVGQTLTGSGVTSGTLVTAFGVGSSGGAGTYTVSVSQNVSTPTQMSGTTLTAVTSSAVGVASGAINGGFILNPPTATSQNIGSAENLYYDLTKPPGNSDSTASATTGTLVPGQSFGLPNLALGTGVFVNAATPGHKVSVTCW